VSLTDRSAEAGKLKMVVNDGTKPTSKGTDRRLAQDPRVHR
jgi:hypothetical protein